jgi:DNA-binding CsgD family transcriptional regulator
MWAELLVEYGVGDVASVVFADTHGCWGFLDLWRSGAPAASAVSAAFTEDEAELLGIVAAIVTPVLRRLQAASFDAGPPTHGRMQQPGPVVLLLGPDLVVLSQTAETEDHLRAIVPPEEGRRPVPATAYNVGAQLLAVEARVDDHPPLTRLHVGGGRWVTMSAARLGASGPFQGRTIAVTLQPTRPADRMAVFARASGLTPRETELVRQLSDGTDTRQLARRLGVSEHTVQDHLKAIFAKTSSSSRLQLVARAFGG